MRAARSFTAFALFALLVWSLLGGPAQAGWRHGGGHGYGGCGYGGYGYGGYGYGGYGYRGYGYGGYGYPGYAYGGYWSEPMAYSNIGYFAASASRPNASKGSMAYGSQSATGGQANATRAAAPTPRTRTEIGAYDNYFQPNNLTVKPGTTVRWTNLGAQGHTISSQQKLFDSGDIQPGRTFTATFPHPGSYSYYSRNQMGEEMRGVIVVQDDSAPVASRQPASAVAETARRPVGEAAGPAAAPPY